MKITKEQLKNIVRETLQEESEYQTFFKKALEKAGKSIPSMSDEEKKAFFNKIEKTWKGRGQKSEGNAFGAAVAKAKKDGDDSFEVDGKEYKTERFGRGHEGPTFGSEEESVNEGVEPQIKKIAYFTGTRPEAVEDFVSKHALNITKLLKYVEKGGLPQRMELVSAVAGRPNNPVQKKIIKMFKESVINEGPSTEEKRIAMLAVRKQAKYRNVSLEQAIQDQINALEDLKRDVKKGKLK